MAMDEEVQIVAVAKGQFASSRGDFERQRIGDSVQELSSLETAEGNNLEGSWPSLVVAHSHASAPVELTGRVRILVADSLDIGGVGRRAVEAAAIPADRKMLVAVQDRDIREVADSV